MPPERTAARLAPRRSPSWVASPSPTSTRSGSRGRRQGCDRRGHAYRHPHGRAHRAATC